MHFGSYFNLFINYSFKQEFEYLNNLETISLKEFIFIFFIILLFLDFLIKAHDFHLLIFQFL